MNVWRLIPWYILHLTTRMSGNLRASGVQEGYWGSPDTTTIFCEEKYANSIYFAEFWNSITSLIYIVVGAYGMRKTLACGFNWCFVFTFASLTITGVGSTLFHMTMRFTLQLTDEIPMLCLGVGFLACQNRTMPLLRGTSGLVFYSFVTAAMIAATIVYIVLGIYDIFIHSCTFIYAVSIILGYMNQGGLKQQAKYFNVTEKKCQSPK